MLDRSLKEVAAEEVQLLSSFNPLIFILLAFSKE
jgi:hypothetical protein